MLALHQVQSDRSVLKDLGMSMDGAKRGRYCVSMNIADDLSAMTTSSHFSSDDDDELRYLHQEPQNARSAGILHSSISSRRYSNNGTRCSLKQCSVVNNKPSL